MFSTFQKMSGYQDTNFLKLCIAIAAFLGRVPASICDFVSKYVHVFVCGQPILSSKIDHIQKLAPFYSNN